MEAWYPGGARGLEEHLRPEDVRPHEGRRIEGRPAVVPLRGEVHDRVGPQRRRRVRDERRAGDGAVHEGVAVGVRALDVRERRAIAGVGEEIEVRDLVVG